MHRQCLSVTIRRMCDKETLGRCRDEWYRSIFTGRIGLGENPRDVAMVDVARELGYDLSGTTTVVTRERLMAADVNCTQKLDKKLLECSSIISNRTKLNDKEAASIYYGIMAVAHKMKLSLYN